MLEHIPGFKRRRSPSNSTLLNLSCQLCYDLLTTPSYSCICNHTFCSACLSFPLLSPQICLLCPHKLTRNTSIEKTISTFTAYCKYSSNGCSIYGPLPMVQDHEKECSYQPNIKCPARCEGFRPCIWEGWLDTLLDHLQRDHGITEEIHASDKAGIKYGNLEKFEYHSQAFEGRVIRLRSGCVYVEMNRLMYDYVILIVGVENRRFTEVSVGVMDRVWDSRRLVRNSKHGLEEAVIILPDSVIKRNFEKVFEYELEVR
jgi:hypothetical protein